MAGNEKCIGKLTLDITDIEPKVKKINQLLAEVGSNTGIKFNIEKEVKKQIDQIYEELKNSVTKIQDQTDKAIKSIENIGKVKINNAQAKKDLADTVKALTDYYNWMAKAEQARAGGHTANQVIYEERAAASLAKVNDALRAEAEGYEKVTAARTRYNTAQNNAAEKQAQKEAQEIEKATQAYIKWEEAKAKVKNLETKGLTGTEEWAKAAKAAGEASDAFHKYTKEVQQAARASDEAKQVLKDLAVVQEAVRQGAVVANAQSNEKERAAAVQEYADALVKLYNEQARVNNLLASGDLKKGTAEYEEAMEELKRLGNTAREAGERLIKMGTDANTAVSGMKEVEKAARAVTDSERNLSKAENSEALRRATDAYNNLKNAINQYNLAKKAQNEQGMATWQAEIDKQMTIVGLIQDEINTLNVDEATRERILTLINNAVTLQDAQAKGVVGTTQATGELEQTMMNLWTRMFGILAVIRTIKEVISNTVEYVTQYSDKMNEIQIITQKTNAEVAQLAKDYMRIAEYMNVSSLDVADAAVYFTRQGLGAEEIERRLKNVTMYAKTANVEFREASELITAVVNSMNLVDQEAEDGRNAVQRVADVFLKVGDSAATSGSEIAEAMQKAAASAGAFGMEFEWLAAYIATVSETTRQEARTIGTAFNTIIARLHQIKQSGYNSEDETRINDIAKALDKVGITLMDQNGEWRDMTEIFQELGDVWGTLDGKTKSYIATTMAGVKQQNVFLALMEDLGQKVEGNSRAWELHEKAINSAGTAQEKYETWTDSVTAAQERLTLAQEKFYSLLDSSVIKQWYDGLAGLVNTFTSATKAMKGLNIVLPIAIGLIVAFTNAIISAGTASEWFATTWEKHPVLLIITAVAATIVTLSAVIGEFADAYVTQEERIEKANERLSESIEKINSLKSLGNKSDEMFKDVEENGLNASETIEKYNSTLDDLSKVSPRAKQAVDDFKNGLISQKEAAEIANEELEKNIELQKKISLGSIRDKYAGYEPTENRSGLYDAIATWPKEVFESYESLGKYLEKWSMTNGNFIWNTDERRYEQINPEAKDYISEQLKDLKDLPWDDRWPIIGQRFWEHYLDISGANGSIETIMQNEVESILEEVYQTAVTGLDDFDAGILRKRLERLLLGDDGIASKEEWETAGKKASQFAMEMFANGFEVSDSERLGNIGEMLLGSVFGEMFSQDDVDTFVSEHPEITHMIFDAYKELLAAGLSEEDIRDFGDMLPEDLKLYQLKGIADFVKTQLRDSLDEVYSDDETGESLIAKLFGDDWEDLDLETLTMLNRLAEAEVSIDDITEAAEGSESVEELIDRLKKLGETSEEVAEQNEDTADSFDDLITAIKSAEKDIKSIDSLLEKIKAGEPISMDDLLDLAKTHKGILGAIDDINELTNELEYLRENKSIEVVAQVKTMILNDKDIAMNSPFAELLDEGQTLQEYLNTLDENSEYYKDVVDYVNASAITILRATGNIEEIVAWEKELVGKTNMEFGNRPQVAAKDMRAAGWEDVGDGYATLFSSTYSTADRPDHYDWSEDVIVNVTPILPNGKVLSPEELDEYVSDLLENTGSKEEIFANDKQRIVISVGEVDPNETVEDAMAREEARMILLHDLEAAIYGVNEAEETWLETMVKEAELNAENEWAKSNGYVEQIGELREALEEGGIDQAMAVWNSYDEGMQKSIAKTYPELASAILTADKAIKEETRSAEKSEEANSKLNSALQKSAKLASAKYFTDTAAAIQKLEAGTISATDAYDKFNKELDNVKKAGEDIITVQDKMADGAEVTSSDVSNLAKLLNMSAEEILADFPAAVSIFDQLTGAGGELADMFDMLNEAAFIRITGVSEVDFSNLENGLFAIRADAQDVIDLLLATGQWEVSTVDLPQSAQVWDPFNKTWISSQEAGKATVLVPKGNNPYKGPTTGRYTGNNNGKNRTTGGGNRDTTKTSTESELSAIEKMLQKMEKIKEIQEWQLSYYKAKEQYYTTTGQTQGVIASLQKEKETLEEESRSLDKWIKKIEKQIEAKKKEIAGLKKGTEAYQKANEELDGLIKTHQEYTIKQTETQTAIEETTKKIKEQQDAIRDQEIKIKQEIYQAIEDREKKKKSMLEGEIAMENKVLDVIKRRYEKERDQIIETAQLKINALQKERDLLSEQLQLRKQQEEEEEKEAKLASLEAQYARIAADPTRAKEAQKIQKEITELRKEMAWDAAEKEVEAQQNAIDQQIDSLEEYIDYVNKYYEDLFNNPQKLIAEMKDVMKMTDDEIIEWLKENDEEYATATENRQKQMEQSWQETLDKRSGTVRTYWEEVEEIYRQGDDAIIKFLMENSEKYAKAGKQQAEAYVDEWRKMLDDLKKMMEDVPTPQAPTYPTTDPDKGTTPTGGDKTPTGGSRRPTPKPETKYGYRFSDDNYKPAKVYDSGKLFQSPSSALTSGITKRNLVVTEYRDRGEYSKIANISAISTYLKGGKIDYTGPAWVDGSKTDPEAILNPYQTKLFETMVTALEQMGKIQIGGMPNYGDIDATGGSTVVGDIIVNVDNLDTDDDYETLAKKVSDVLMERIGRTTVVGGLRNNYF